MARVKMLRSVRRENGVGVVETYAKGSVFNVPDELAAEWMAEAPPPAWTEGEDPPAVDQSPGEKAARAVAREERRKAMQERAEAERAARAKAKENEPEPPVDVPPLELENVDTDPGVEPDSSEDD